MIAPNQGSAGANETVGATQLQLWQGEDGIRFDTTSGKKLFDVVNLSDHSNVHLA